jgi:hypothetical protein
MFLFTIFYLSIWLDVRKIPRFCCVIIWGAAVIWFLFWLLDGLFEAGFWFEVYPVLFWGLFVVHFGVGLPPSILETNFI